MHKFTENKSEINKDQLQKININDLKVYAIVNQKGTY